MKGPAAGSKPQEAFVMTTETKQLYRVELQFEGKLFDDSGPCRRFHLAYAILRWGREWCDLPEALEQAQKLQAELANWRTSGKAPFGVELCFENFRMDSASYAVAIMMKP